jgi:hypothetical protein
MRDHARLREHWNAATGDMGQRLAVVNAITEPGPRQAIQMTAVRECLVSRGKWRVLQIHALMVRTSELRRRLGQPEVSEGVRAAAYLLRLVEDGGALQVPQLSVLKKLLDDLTADAASGIGSDDAAALWALSETVMPWWKSVYGRPVSTFDLIEAQLAA